MTHPMTPSDSARVLEELVNELRDEIRHQLSIREDYQESGECERLLGEITAALAALKKQEVVAWQPVRGFEGIYEVAPNGAVRKVNGCIIGQWPNDQGYALVRLTAADGARSLARVHRLVAEAFVPNPHGLPFVNHIDNDRGHNDAANLEWCTQEQNLAHMTAQGRRAAPHAGKRSPNARLSDETAAAIREEYATGAISHQALADKYGIAKRTVGRILSGKSYLPAPPASPEQTP